MYERKTMVLYAQRGEPRATMDRLLLAESDECIEWPHGTSKGYGRLWDGDKVVCVHVIACTHHHGERPDGTEVAHSCGNRSCVNRDHLRWATRQENLDDMIGHGTRQYGERHPRAKLTAANVAVILSDASTTGVELAERFNVTPRTIYDIRHGRRWGNPDARRER